jgi:regulator of sigma E protease
METFFIRALQLILSLSILVILHEFGHFLFSRVFKVRVEKFYLFFNPYFSLIRFKKINGKWRVKYLSKNDPDNVREKINEDGTKGSEIIPTEAMADNDWRKYPESMEWGIGWLPLGGFVSISGMIDESMNVEQMKQPEKPWEFRSKKPWQRLFIMIGGVLVNFILALVIYSAVLFTWGETYLDMKNTPMQFSKVAMNVGYKNGDCIVAADHVELGRYSESNILSAMEAKDVTVLREGQRVNLKMPEGGLMAEVLKQRKGFATVYSPAIIDSVMPTYPAAKFLQKEDKITAINDSAVLTMNDVVKQLDKNKAKIVKVEIQRNGNTLVQNIPLNKDGKFGFIAKSIVKPQVQHFGFFESIPAGIKYGIGKLQYYVRQMKFIFTKAGAASIGGFGAIGGMFPSMWDWCSFWETTAFLSIVLAFMNILPIPALDGGHVLFLLYEMITGRKPSDKFLTYAQTAGMLLLFALLFYANGMDIVRALFR